MQNESTPSPLPSTFPTPRRSLPFPRPIPTVAEPPFAVAKSKQQAERSKMGCASSSPAGDSTAAEKATNQAIDDEIRKDRAMRRMEAKMLLLGAGESGKSTIIKQMRLAYREPFNEVERHAYREIVYANVTQSAQAVLVAFDEVAGIPIPHDLQRQAAFLMEIDVTTAFGDSQLDPRVTAAIVALWDERSTREVVEQAASFQLNDSAPYFFEEIRRIGSAGYVPSDADILRARVRTTGITEERFKVRDYLLRVFDVGGQRSERKKWIHCFENCQVVVFVAALSEYDQKLWEDESVNRLDEATQLFESLTSSRWFAKSSFVLLLNKLDLFKAKLVTSPLGNTYSDYTGGDDLALATTYMAKKFTDVYQRGLGVKRQLYTHATCATDTTQCRVVIAAMLDTIISATLTEVGLM